MSRANPPGRSLKAIAVVYWRLTTSPATRGSSSGGRFCCKRKRGARMDGYNFWKDLLDTYQSLSDGMKALWLIVPAAFVLGLSWLILRTRVALRKVESGMRGDLVYTIHRDADDVLHVTRHGGALQREPAVVLLEEGSRRDGGDVQ